MASIPKIFHTIEKREMSLSEYEKYAKEHSFQSSIKAIRCVECGDEIVYCNGDNNVAYFKHSPTHEGHGYCSLYHEGTESNSNESLIRKKLFKEEDISLNFELKYQDGKRKSLITIPPFNQKDLEKNTINNTRIMIEVQNNKYIEIPVDKNRFKSGELKKIGLNDFPQKIKIKITGNSASRDVCYVMEGFMPNQQIYSSLILQNYTEDQKSFIILKNIKMFACKRISGKIYTGRHYLLFSYGDFDLKISNDVKKDMSIVKLELNKDCFFNYSVYDVVFNEVTEQTENFCANRGCELVKRDDAVILRPPMNSIGNYKYYKNGSNKMYIVFENDTNALEMREYDTSDLYFKVKNINVTPFFVTKFDKLIAMKKITRFDYKNNSLVELDKRNKNYYLKNGFLKSREDSGQIRIKKNDELISIKSGLERTIYKLAQIDLETLKNAIWYSKEYVLLRDIHYNYLIEKYKNNEFISSYLEICARSKRIKKAAIELLLEA